MINIALGFDSNFAPYAAVTIKSILQHNQNVNFYLMYDNLKKSDMAKIDAMIDSEKGGGGKTFWGNMSGKFNNLFTGSWSSSAVYFPLALPSICKDERILFLDADTMVTGDLSDFYNQDLTGYYLAGVHDYGMVANINSGEEIATDNNKKLFTKEYFNNFLNWNIEEMKKYFNSGMMLMNLKLMREENIEEKIYASLKEKTFAFPDQDCINYVCHAKVKILEPKYNYMVLHDNTWDNLSDEVKNSLLKYKQEKEIPLIVHFLKKPWRKPAEEVSFSKTYNQLRKLTPYKNHRSKQETFQFRWSKKGKYLRILNKTIFDFSA